MTETNTQSVEPTAPDATVTPELEDGAAPSPAVTDTDDIATKAKGVGKRIDELTRLRRDAERDRDHWREMAMRNQSPQQQPPATPDKPKELADFEYDETKYRAYVAEEVRKEAAAVARQELAAERERQDGERRKASFKSRSTDFAKTVEDFQSVAYARDLPISPDMAEVIQDSDDGPALLYHLGKNPDIAEKIALLPPKAAARELGKIEARLAFEREKAKPNKVSTAPPPPPKVEGADPGTLNVKPDSPDSDALSDEEWARKRNKQLERRRSN